MLAAQGAHQLDPAHAGHHPVNDDQIIVLFLLDHLIAAFAVLCVIDIKAGLDQIITDDLADIFVIVNNQDTFHHQHLFLIKS